ncbi:3-phosphoshikimate 1-carboxyvinyltransferase [Flavobacterium psychrophilum]|uniref:3-phosphoshikimate 1-carboxyvinyltransferase n=1 Tax=Flavobacterium psychrophilum TaxID=96345 RepID=A0A7U2UF82_FLAPS|nr:3-phosphoshikimate 1-carboxyvinyltransferase [Flavobacterium psychrophilum]ELY1979714.1 3-phosphoshikimate 1-carboxyvinyltransferase [Flavobacterium psychrophilum]MBF2022864.1 3-phosphoshikimate 1-carboxyvinyltransferase [Flavobacterium psychrophilum]MCB5982578.1 3-phosphoshikimate 1-carboxyvinyltransferase [Flavobacterium psychrophilum]MCB5994402.1 3-phosphoshikimate 1-carboxyvinyltransferase [Flavobacterium psychrophilum]MCB5996813.1 3-phosphoshikimate 1-carboxyvinyltransferase [Flavobact
MNLHLHSIIINQQSTIKISGSKSETNRLLLLQALYPNITLDNISSSDDSQVMIKALASKTQEIDIHHAGTAMRFLTAYFAQKEGKEVILTGSSRMKERPIKILVEALQQLGAEIEYVENEGFAPIKIAGKKIVQHKISLLANVSSQYISALLLIAPKLENGLELTLVGEIASTPYIKMTLALLNDLGIETSFIDNKISVLPQFIIHNSQFTIESDWSSASYFYSIIALSEIGTRITLSSYKQNSLQGDCVLAEIYKDFGVETVFNLNKTISITKINNCQLSAINYQLNNAPDIAQTIAVTCFGLRVGCHLTGLHTLKIKETDRLEALKVELTKLGATISVTNNSLTLEGSSNIHSDIKIKTYQDHRMAMAFAPLALRTSIIIEDAGVVSKSYPNFWNDLQSIGFRINEI